MEFEEVENIGQRIKEIRKSKSITIQKLSQFTDLSVGYLSNLERNQASPTLSNLQRICVALGISIRDLLSPSGEERTLIRQEEQQLYEYDEYKLQIRRLDFGKKRGIYEFSTYDPETKDTPPSWGLHPYAREARRCRSAWSDNHPRRGRAHVPFPVPACGRRGR